MKKDYNESAKMIVDGLGGNENIESIMCCATRLRVDLKNADLLNEKEIKKAGAFYVMKLGGGAFQLIMGPTANLYEDAIKQLLHR